MTVGDRVGNPFVLVEVGSTVTIVEMDLILVEMGLIVVEEGSILVEVLILVKVGSSVVGAIIEGMMTNVSKLKHKLLLYCTAHFGMTVGVS